MTLVKIEAPELSVIKESKAQQIKSTFEPMVEMLEQFEELYNEIVKESENGITKELVAKAKRIRIDISKVRTGTETLRKEQKEESLREGKAIDGVSNIIKWAVTDKENKLKEIENYFEIQEKKRLEELQAERVEMLSPYVEDAHERDLSSMDSDVWNAYFNTKKQDHADKIEAEKEAERQRIEAERIKQLDNKRRTEALPFNDYWEGILNYVNITDYSDEEFNNVMQELKHAKEEDLKEQERIRKEKERLEKEAKLKQQKEEALMLRSKARNKELQPYIIFIRDYDKMLKLNDEEYQKELAEIKIGAEQHWEHEKQERIKQNEKEEKERLEREKLHAELKAKEEAEQKEKQRLLDEELAKKKAEKAARLAPDKVKLLQYANLINDIQLPELKTMESAQILADVIKKVNDTIEFIKSKANDL